MKHILAAIAVAALAWPAMAKGPTALSSSPAAIQWIPGTARAIDGDTIEVGGERIRLAGIDAPERGQWCSLDTKTTDRCGVSAYYYMGMLVNGQRVLCEGHLHDRYGRLIATCSTPETPDLGEAMVRSGHAVRYPQYDRPGRYIAAEAEARRERRGVWAGDFTMPWDWRKERRR